MQKLEIRNWGGLCSRGELGGWSGLKMKEEGTQERALL
jgi:hypothetical protein